MVDFSGFAKLNKECVCTQGLVRFVQKSQMPRSWVSLPKLVPDQFNLSCCILACESVG